jgi:glycosyltransferase involved in cell wall biosynthesis
MKYSFIVPTYNSEQWIEPCISSILAQTYTGFDIIILDSGSTDGTLHWISTINDKRIRLYTTDKRLNIVENWLRITTIARNEFMTIMGHDDILYPHYLDTINKLTEEFPDAGLYQTHFNFIDDKGKIIRACTRMENSIIPAKLLEDILKNKIEITATGYMMRSKQYDLAGGIPPYSNLLYADIELWLKMILTSYLAVSPENCFEFRLHIGNTSKATNIKRLAAFERLIDFFCTLKNTTAGYGVLIEDNALQFLKEYVIGSCHKLIYISKPERNGVTMDNIIATAKKGAQKLLPNTQFTPENFKEIHLAKLIDGNAVLRSLFLFYKSFKKRTY